MSAEKEPRNGEQTSEPQEGGAKRDALKGVFSTQEVRKVGTGTTVRKTIQKSYWYVDEKDGIIEVQPLNSNYVPSGPKRTVQLEDIIASFQPEPEFYLQTVYPKMREMNTTIARGDRHRSRGEHFSAEFEYNNALKVDEENVRANFGLGLTYLERGETEKADNIFERLVKLDAAFEREHKHLFNEFGINLRKNKMFDQAVDYYSRALELSGSDDHLHYNLARACFDKEDYGCCADHLFKCLAINQTLDVGVKFLMWLRQKEKLPEDKIQQADETIKRCVVAMKQEEQMKDKNGGADGQQPAKPAKTPDSAGADNGKSQEGQSSSEKASTKPKDAGNSG